MLLPALSEPILHRVELIGRFLRDDLLLAECHFMRSRVFTALEQFDNAIAHLSEAAQLFEHLGDGFRQAQCIGQIGTLQLQLERADLAEQSLSASLRLLNAGPENDGLLAPTYEELAQIAGRKHDPPTAARYYALAGEARLRQKRFASAALDFQASVPLFLLHGDDEAALANAQKFFALREQGLAEPASSEIDQDFVELIAHHVSGLAATGLAARNALAQRANGPAAERNSDNPYRWATLAKRGLPLTNQAATRARIQLAAAAVALDRSDAPSAAEDAAAALAFFEGSDDLTNYVGVVQIVAEAEQRRGRSAQALAAVERALARIDGCAHPAAILALQSQKVSALASLGRTRDAVDTLSEALALARQGDDASHKYYQGSLTAALGAIHQRVHQIEAAVPVELEALRIALEIGSRSAAAHQLTSLGVACGMLSADWSHDLNAKQRWELLAMIASQGIGTTVGEWHAGMTAESLASLAADVGTQLLRRAIEAYREVGDFVGEAIAQGNLSNFAGADDAQRIAKLQDALAQLRSSGGSPRSEAVLLANMGKCYLSQQRVAEAQTCFEYSLSLSDASGDCEWAYDTASDLASTYLVQGMPADGVKYLRMAIHYTEMARRDLPLEDAMRVAFARGRPEA